MWQWEKGWAGECHYYTTSFVPAYPKVCHSTAQHSLIHSTAQLNSQRSGHTAAAVMGAAPPPGNMADSLNRFDAAMLLAAGSAPS